MSVPFVSFPGVAGNYVSTPDVNLLDADTAHLHQSIGTWASQAGGHTLTVADDSASLFGGTALSFELESVSAVPAIRSDSYPDGAPVTAAVEYALSLWIRTPFAGEEARLMVQWRDGAGASTGQVLGTFAAISSTYSQLTLVATAPALTESATIWVYYAVTAGGDVPQGARYLSAVCIREGTDATFVPSLRIVGDLDVRMKAAARWATDAGTKALVSTYNGANQGFEIEHVSGNRLQGWYGDGTDVNSGLSADIATADGQIIDLQVTCIPGTEWSFSVDGSLISATPVGAFTPLPDNQPLNVGRRPVGGLEIAADIYSATLRDGIDGPIVAQFLATDIP